MTNIRLHNDMENADDQLSSKKEKNQKDYKRSNKNKVHTQKGLKGNTRKMLTMTGFEWWTVGNLSSYSTFQIFFDEHELFV